jgi:hypothetical protein
VREILCDFREEWEFRQGQEDFGEIFERFLEILLQRNRDKYVQKEKNKFVSTLVDPREGKHIKHSQSLG